MALSWASLCCVKILNSKKWAHGWREPSCIRNSSASFSLALDYLFDPQTREAPYIKDELEQFVAFLKPSKSALINRGLNILECVMSAWGTPPPPGTTWFAAREGPVSPTSWAQGPFHQVSVLTRVDYPITLRWQQSYCAWYGFEPNSHSTIWPLEY